MVRLSWRLFIISMVIYILCSQIVWYYQPIHPKAQFSIIGYETRNEMFTLNFSINTNAPLKAKVTLVPVTEKTSNLSVYIFYDKRYPAIGTSWEGIHMLRSNLKRELLLRGFKGDVILVSADELEELMSRREKAIVIVASGGLPANVFSHEVDLVRPWLDDGGTLIWFGWPPGYYTVYEGQVENESFCLLPQHLFEEGLRRLGIEEFIKVKPYENLSEVAETPSYMSELLDINYNLINYGTFLDPTAEKGLVIGKLGGNPSKSSVSVIPVGKGNIIVFGFFVFSSYILNGPELSARDIAQILYSGVIHAAKSSSPVYKEYNLSRGQTITDNMQVKIGVDVKGVVLYAYSTLSSNCLLYEVEFYPV